MATEIITPYPLPPWREPMDSFTDNTLRTILDKISRMEETLSRIEGELSRNHPRE